MLTEGSVLEAAWENLLAKRRNAKDALLLRQVNQAGDGEEAKRTAAVQQSTKLLKV